MPSEAARLLAAMSLRKFSIPLVACLLASISACDPGQHDHGSSSTTDAHADHAVAPAGEVVAPEPIAHEEHEPPQIAHAPADVAAPISEPPPEEPQPPEQKPTKPSKPKPSSKPTPPPAAEASELELPAEQPSNDAPAAEPPKHHHHHH